MKQRIWFILLCFCWANTLTAQSLAPQNASTGKQEMGLKEFYGLITGFHPLVRQADLLSDGAQEEIRMARGFFDPKIGGDLTRKQFQDKLYYNLLDVGIKVPTWTGIDIQAGFEQNRGQFLSEQNATDKGRGIYYLGVNIPLGQGLFADYRRNAVLQAQYFQQIAEADQIKTINKILLQAAKDYWEWYLSYQVLEISKLGVELADERFQAVKKRAILGDLAIIDTVEAKILLQERQISLRQAEVDYVNARYMLETYLWDQGNQPAALKDNVIPALEVKDLQTITNNDLDRLLSFAKTNHPEIRKIDGKLLQLMAERRLAVENLKPVLNLKFNALSGAGGDVSPDFGYTFMRNNHYAGIDFAMPLFLRKERGKLGLVKVKLTQTELERIQLNRDINNELYAIYNEVQTLRNLIGDQSSMVNNYRTLREGELEKFNNGESSLFLINTRESKLLESQAKLASMQTKYLKARATLQWAAGRNETMND